MEPPLSNGTPLYWYSDGDSDFFTLDPNLATALRLTNAGGNSAAIQAQRERGRPRQKKGSVARQGKNGPFPVVGYCARLGGSSLAVASFAARFRSHAADAL